MKPFKILAIIAVLAITSAFVHKKMDNALTNGMYKKWKIQYVLIDDKEMTSNEIPDIDCLKKQEFIFFENKTVQRDTSCGLKQYSDFIRYTQCGNQLIIDEDTMEVVELCDYKLKLRRKVTVTSDSVTISPETSFVNFDMILYAQ
jgi:hypothetical protein